MSTAFNTDYAAVLSMLENINPVKYASTRNYINGAVTYLSPYLSRGVIALPQVQEKILAKYSIAQSEKLLQELAWREYYQRVWQAKGEAIFTDLKQRQPDVQQFGIPTAVVNAGTGISAIDEQIKNWYRTGYLHNHVRMYVSSMVCNVAKTHWLQPSQWMYYHLLDGDLASNSLSWQWVAGSFSSKKYYCNQENINQYTNSQQRNTFMDQSYENIATMPVPEQLNIVQPFALSTQLPETPLPVLQPEWPILVYNSYNLDPLWHQGENANRILLLDPDHFNPYPVSEKVLDFILGLSNNIPGLQVYTGSFESLQKLGLGQSIHFKKHPAFPNYQGVAEEPEWLFPKVSGYFPSFFSYWKKCEKWL